jgi:hypothetical protein
MQAAIFKFIVEPARQIYLTCADEERVNKCENVEMSGVNRSRFCAVLSDGERSSDARE